jgi:hypothetical protein
MEDIQHGDTVKLEHAIAESYYVKENNKAFTSIVVFDLSKVPTKGQDPSS